MYMIKYLDTFLGITVQYSTVYFSEMHLIPEILT